MGLSAQSHLFPKKWVFNRKPTFSGENKKTIFLESGRIVYQNVCFRFFVFTSNKLVFAAQNDLFPRKFVLVQSHFLSYEKFGFALKTFF